MVKHIVLFQLDAAAPVSTLQAAKTAFKTGIEALPALIPCIRDIRVSFNMNPGEKFDICLESSFDSLADVRLYSNHPEHLKVAGALKPLIAARACTDFEV